MKTKNVFLTAVIAFFGSAVFVLLFVLAMRIAVPQSEMDIKDRIKQYNLIREEQELITDIWTLRYEAAVMQAKFNPVPDANTP